MILFICCSLVLFYFIAQVLTVLEKLQPKRRESVTQDITAVGKHQVKMQKMMQAVESIQVSIGTLLDELDNLLTVDL